MPTRSGAARSMQEPFCGSFVALPTPFEAGGATVDLDALRGLVELHAHSATRGVVPAGTTGEASALTDAEYHEVLRATVRAAAGRLEVIAGVGTNCTRTTLERALVAQAVGADAVLAVTPYYNRPGPAGLLAHFGALAEALSIPVVLYNVPARTGCDLTPDLVAHLHARHPGVVAIKQAAPSIERVRELAAIDGLRVLCGEDALLPEFVRAGASGAIGVTSNLVPDAFAAWIDAAARGDEAALATSTRRLVPLAKALFVEPNPVPVKAALALLGRCRADVRLPLVELSPTSAGTLAGALARAELGADPSAVAPAAPATAAVPSRG